MLPGERPVQWVSCGGTEQFPDVDVNEISDSA